MSRIIFSEQQIQARVRTLAEEINDRFRGEDIVLVGLLNGGVILLADLARELERVRATEGGVKDCYLDFIRVSSYGNGQESSGRVCVEMDMQKSPVGKHVVIVDDVGDTLHTMHFVRRHLLDKRPASVSTCVLVAKPDRFQRPDIQLDFVGFSQVDLPYLKGFGMDDRGTERGLPYIAKC